MLYHENNQNGCFHGGHPVPKAYCFSLLELLSHSIVQGGPSFSALHPAIYFYLADANLLYVLSQLRGPDFLLNAGTLVYLQILLHLCSQEHWNVLNFVHFV